MNEDVSTALNSLLDKTNALWPKLFEVGRRRIKDIDKFIVKLTSEFRVNALSNS